jgi:undecaprenyl-diphosphatase
MRRRRLTPCDALLLGIVQGPSELLPVSSSAHIALLADVLGGSGAVGDEAELRDSLEVALHAGAAAALLIAGRGELARAARELNGSQLVVGALALAPAALVGYLLERGPGARGGGPRAIAAGLSLGAVAMVLADRRPRTRTLAQATPCDGLLLGVAQAAALLPGVSRNGATLTAARARGFERDAAQALSWRVGLPVILGAAALKTHRLAQRGASAASLRVLAAGAGGAFLSTLAGAPLIGPGRRGRRLAPLALYRIVLAAAAICGPRLRSRLRGAHNGSR